MQPWTTDWSQDNALLPPNAIEKMRLRLQISSFTILLRRYCHQIRAQL